jgi:hypothetical protein
MTFSSGDIPTSRISRLLRSLRVKCSALESSSSTATASKQYCTVYSTKSIAPSDLGSTPPLQLLAHPNSSSNRVYFSQADIENQALAKRIYAIRDAFRDIVVKSDTEHSIQTVHALRVPRLAELCANIIGADLEAEPDSEDEESLQDVEFDNRAEELYEFVPSRYRR